LVLQYQQDENVYAIADQYMLGNDLMVCPVTTKGAVTRTVYLPEGEWFNYWTGEKWTGKKYIHVLTPLDQVPIFVRSGAIIPMHPAMKYFGEKPVEVITLDVYPGNAKGALLYEDDGTSLDYTKGKSTETNYELKESAKEINININVVSNQYKVAPHSYEVIVHMNAKPNQVLVNGQAVKSDFNSAKKLLMIQTDKGINQANCSINIKL
jgi:alpha-glucosidase (family GH31 glycosyl hydrolase)